MQGEEAMTLPPIITNSPIYKALTGGQSRPAKAAEEKAAPTPASDRVEISDAALRKLDALKAEDLKSQGTARETAVEVRYDLEKNPDLSLGLDPSAEL